MSKLSNLLDNNRMAAVIAGGFFFLLAAALVLRVHEEREAAPLAKPVGAEAVA